MTVLRSFEMSESNQPMTLSYQKIRILKNKADRTSNVAKYSFIVMYYLWVLMTLSLYMSNGGKKRS